MRKSELVRQRAAILVLVAIVVLLAVLAPEQKPPGAAVPPSTFHAEEGGAKALYEAAEALGVSVRRWMRRAGDLPPEAGVVVSLAPSAEIDRLEVEQLLEWVESGGWLVTAAQRYGDPLAKELALGQEPSNEETLTRARALSRLASRLTSESAERMDAFGVAFDPSDEVVHEALFVDHLGRPGVTLVEHGAGRVLALAGTEGLTNATLEDSEAALLVLRTLVLGAEYGDVLFDEYHHGHEEGRGVVQATLGWLVGTRAGWAVLALFVIGFLALVTGGLRQGRPLPPPPKPRRSSLEHVLALAEAYRRSRAVARPARELALHLRQVLGAAELERELERVTRSNPRSAPDAELVLAALRGPVDLVELAAAIDRVRAVAPLERRRELSSAAVSDLDRSRGAVA